jgi:hypothetical protein
MNRIIVVQTAALAACVVCPLVTIGVRHWTSAADGADPYGFFLWAGVAYAVGVVPLIWFPGHWVLRGWMVLAFSSVFPFVYFLLHLAIAASQGQL